ncbi:12795_t:CDS:2, partial [Cetraspora pellucida]
MHTIIQEEEAVLKKELEWLLNSQLPDALYNLKKALKVIIAILYPCLKSALKS